MKIKTNQTENKEQSNLWSEDIRPREQRNLQLEDDQQRELQATERVKSERGEQRGVYLSLYRRESPAGFAYTL